MTDAEEKTISAANETETVVAEKIAAIQEFSRRVGGVHLASGLEACKTPDALKEWSVRQHAAAERSALLARQCETPWTAVSMTHAADAERAAACIGDGSMNLEDALAYAQTED